MSARSNSNFEPCSRVDDARLIRKSLERKSEDMKSDMIHGDLQSWKYCVYCLVSLYLAKRAKTDHIHSGKALDPPFSRAE
jgi:hypothetical protein